MQTMPLKKFCGLVVAGAGIAWYSYIKANPGRSAASAANGGSGGGGGSGHTAPPPIKTGHDGSGSHAHEGSLTAAKNGAQNNGGAHGAVSLEGLAGAGGSRNWKGQVVSPRRGTHFQQ